MSLYPSGMNAGRSHSMRVGGHATVCCMRQHRGLVFVQVPNLSSSFPKRTTGPSLTQEASTIVYRLLHSQVLLLDNDTHSTYALILTMDVMSTWTLVTSSCHWSTDLMTPATPGTTPPPTYRWHQWHTGHFICLNLQWPKESRPKEFKS